MKRFLKILLVVLILLFVGLSIYLRWIFDPILGPLSDQFTHRLSLRDPVDFDKGGVGVSRVSFNDLPQYVVQRDRLGERYSNRSFVRVDGVARYEYVVAHHRVRDFLHGQRFIGRRIPLFENTQYVLIDPSVLKMLSGLHTAMDDVKLDSSAIQVVSGFRPPSYNNAVGGKSRSRHLHGDAVDIKVGDVNRDGRVDDTDRSTIYELLDAKIVRSKGGLGTYKNSPQVIHFDARGKRARWRY